MPPWNDKIMIILESISNNFPDLDKEDSKAYLLLKILQNKSSSQHIT